MMYWDAISPELLGVLRFVGSTAGAYLVGAIPLAWLLARWITGSDLRKLGSGNVGVMNTALSVCRWAGLLVFLSEIAKGMFVVFAARLLEADGIMTGAMVVAVVVGTRWPVWLRFEGGRGNTTGMAACLLVSYQSLLAVLAVWVLARLAVSKSFTATRLTIISIPVIFWFVTQSWWFTLTGLVLSLIYLSAQKTNSDDHLLIKQQWSSFWRFLTSPRRR